MPDPSTASLAAPSLFDLPFGVNTFVWLSGTLFISGALGLLQASLELVPASRVLTLVPEGQRHDRLSGLLAAPDALLVSASLLKLTFELTFLALLLPVIALDGLIDVPALLGAIAIGDRLEFPHGSNDLHPALRPR